MMILDENFIDLVQFNTYYILSYSFLLIGQIWQISGRLFCFC